MKTITIDRFEEDNAVCEDGKKIRVLPRASLPAEAKPGDTLHYKNNRWYINTDTTVSRAAEIEARFERIKRRNTI